MSNWRSGANGAALDWREVACLAYVAIIYLAADGFYIVERLHWIGAGPGNPLSAADYARRAVFLFGYALAIAAVYALSRSSRRVVVPALALFGGFWLVDLNAHAVLGRPAGLSNISVLNAAAGQVGQAVREFAGTLVGPFVWSLLLLIPLGWRAWRGVQPLARPWFWLPLGGLLALYGAALGVRGEQAVIGFPKGFSYAFGSMAVALNERMTAPVQEAGALVPQEDRRHAWHKVVLIVDESIRHDTFAELFKAPPPQAVSYGRAFSAANCSAASNYVLRKAGWPRALENQAPVREFESLFSLARRAGYRTAYIDNQNVLGDPAVRNYFNQAEEALIDQVVVATGEGHDRDIDSLETLRELLRHDMVFILVNKVGAHFPYAEMIPPALRQGQRLADYRTAVRLNAVEYLRKVAAMVDARTLVFYTSDHGQDMQARTPHCNVGDQVSPQEFAVPFVVLSGHAKALDHHRSRLNTYRNRLSHLEIAESVRNALGYRIDIADSIFKEPLFLKHDLCGVHGPPKPMFGAGPRCTPLRNTDPGTL